MGAVTAPNVIANFSHSYPRLTPQLITAICSTLTICVKWGFSGAITIYARKHLQQAQPIHNIELLSALKNGALVWGWVKRPMRMSGTLAAAALCGLLTSGFVALITPFPVATTTPINKGTLTEFDFSSSDDSCFEWCSKTNTGPSSGEDCWALQRYTNSTIVYYACTYKDPFGDDITSVKSAMIYGIASDLPSQKTPILVYSLPLLQNTRLVGGTAGTLPLGPAGVEAFPNSTFPHHPTTISSYNYTLGLQGIWAESSCAYVNNSQLLLSPAPWTPRTIRMNCSDGETPQQWDYHLSPIPKAGMILAGLCYSRQKDTMTLHVRSLWNNQDDGFSSATLIGIYAGIGSVRCTFTPRIGIVNATYQTDLAAFNLTQRPDTSTPFSMMRPLAQGIVIDAITAMLGTLAAGQTGWNGNSFGGAIYYVVGLYGGVAAQQQTQIVLDVLADGLKGLFEFHVSKRRLRLAAFNGIPPNQSCLRPVTGVLIERHIGWNYSRGTVLGLIPLVIISLASIALILRTIMQDGHLTLFDPTDPVSLLAAAGDGKLQFATNESQKSPIGDPRDEFVKNTSVIYGEHERGWGLKAE